MTYSKRSFRGFTLIELLVVIAIIGILSAVVLASLNQARVKGNYAQMKSDLNSIQQQAEIFYDKGQTYGPATATSTGITCLTTGIFSDTTISSAIAQVKQIPGVTTIGCGIGTNGSFYDVEVTDSITGNWCVNSTGIATNTATC